MAATERTPRTLLGFDYGTRKIGVAVGQEVSCTAAPVTTLAARGSQPDWDAIAGLIDSWRPDALVVGIPRHLNDAEHEITRAARRFGRRLHQRFGLPVFEAEERLSSREARGVTAQQRAAGRRARVRKGDLDRVAAQIILQDWLQQQEACRD
jgi:putative Holliday junction resolvase